jgi:hypothetical protein
MAKHIRFYTNSSILAHRRRTANDGRGNLGWLGLLVLCAISNLGAATPDVSYAAGSSQKLEQLIGDTDFQTGQPTLSQTKANYNLANTDLGVSFRHKNQTYIMFGDSNFPGTADAMGYTTDTDPEAGLTLLFLNTGNFTPIQIPGILHGAFDVPIYGVSSAGKMYLYYSTDADANVPTMLDEVLTTAFAFEDELGLGTGERGEEPRGKPKAGRGVGGDELLEGLEVGVAILPGWVGDVDVGIGGNGAVC